MDNSKALGYLREFKNILDANFNAWKSHDWNELQRTDDALNQKIRSIRAIAIELDPHAPSHFAKNVNTWPWQRTHNYIFELIGELEEKDRVNEIMGPSGPTISASEMHPTVWSAASRLWNDGHRRAAIQAAASQLDQELKAKLGVEKSGEKLFMYAFDIGTAPTPELPKLRFKDGRAYPPGSENWKSQHEGAKFFGAGCMSAIRNLATHDTEEIDEQEALEQLAALSVLARWVDVAIVATSGD